MIHTKIIHSPTPKPKLNEPRLIEYIPTGDIAYAYKGDLCFWLTGDNAGVRFTLGGMIYRERNDFHPFHGTVTLSTENNLDEAPNDD